MGGLLHLFDFHQGNTGRKHKNRGDGVKAPHNRLQLPAETSQSHYAVGSSEQNLDKTGGYETDASMKKLIDQEISKRSINRQTAPSVVAKLMGMDVLPTDAKPEIQSYKDKIDKMGIATHKVKHPEKVSAPRSSKKSKSSTKKENRTYRDSYFRYWSSGTNSGRPQPRVHPQEKELQKFKKEFEAWQAARFLECARVVELGNIPDQWLAQLNLTTEKMALYESSRNTVVDTKSKLLKSKSLLGGGIQHLQRNELYSLSSRSSSKDIDDISFKSSDKNSDKSSAPAKIVILKPGPDGFTTSDESWVSSSSSVEDRDCIEDLLEEVKERLKFEMQGMSLKKGSMVRGGGIETPFKEKPAYTKPAGDRDLERKLLRSESARSTRCEDYVNELTPCSPEFFSRDTRKFLSERLRNVLTREDQQDISNISHDFSKVPFIDNARERLEKARDILNAEAERNHWCRYMNYEDNMQASSFRHELCDEKSVPEQPSPRNLVRSLSAPLSRTSFGKLLVEDRFVSDGAHIKRKYETVDNLTMDAKCHTREGFNFREKVSNIKNTLSLRKKLFSKKLQSVDFTQSNEFDTAKDILLNTPTVLSSFNYRNENLSELPPSPASICNSPREDFWKPGENCSPLSTSDVTSVGDHSVGKVFREISSNLTELRKQLNQLEYEGSEITTVTEYPSETEVADLEDESEAYIKTLLVTSGLYDGSIEKSFSRWDPYVKPMSNWVFDKIEESYQKPTNETDEVSMNHDDMKLDHKLLFDLLNEALIIVLSPPRTLSKFRRKITDTTVYDRPQGKKLVKKVWEMIREHVYSTRDMVCYSLDDLAAHDMEIMAWSDLISEEVSGIGKELEIEITNEVVEQVLMDMKKP